MIKRFDFISLFLLISVVLLLLLTFSFNEFWQDELYSIVHFQLVPFNITVTDYHSTNNHILYNGLVSLFLKTAAIDSLPELMERPYLIRAFSGIFSLFTALVLYQKSFKHFNKAAAYLIVFILLSSMVFVNFSMQARGYSLGTLLVTLSVFSFYELRKADYADYRKFGWMTFYSVLLMLLLPTNIYYLASISFIILIDLIIAFRPGTTNKNRSRLLFIIILHSIIILAVVGYYLWLQSMQPPNYFLETFTLFKWKLLSQLFIIPYHFFHFRFIGWFLIVLSLLQNIKRLNLPVEQKQSLLLMGGLFVLPMIFYFLHGTLIIQRIFIPIIPIFSIITGLLFYNLLQFAPRKWFILWQVSTLFCFFYGIYDMRKGALEDNINSQNSMGLRYHTYLFNFNPLEATKMAQEMNQSGTLPVIVQDHFGERGIYFYFDALAVTYKKILPDYPVPAVYVTNDKKSAENWFVQHGVSYKKLIPDNYMYTVYVIEN